jgi:hypothetical protein
LCSISKTSKSTDLNFEVDLIRESPASKQVIQAFEHLYKKYQSKLSVLIQPLTLAEAHLDPVCCVYDNSSKEIVSQIFNFVDVMGGKSAVNLESKLYRMITLLRH